MATLSNNDKFAEDLQAYIEAGMKEAIGEAFDKALDDIRERRDEFIAKQALKMSAFFEIQTQGEKVVISVTKDLKN